MQRLPSSPTIPWKLTIEKKKKKTKNSRVSAKASPKKTSFWSRNEIYHATDCPITPSRSHFGSISWLNGSEWCFKRWWRMKDTLGSFSKDDGYGYGNATKQEYYWLKKEKCSCCTCNTNFRAFRCRTPQNNNVKSPNFRFWRQREHITMEKSFSVLTLKPFAPIHLQDSSPVLYNVNKTD